MNMNQLRISGLLQVVDPKPIRMEHLSSLVAKFEAPLELHKKGDLFFVGIVESKGVAPGGEEEHFKDFLAAVGRELPGLLLGSFEVWWPFAIEAGPQKWELTEDGHLLVHESAIIWEEPTVHA